MIQVWRWRKKEEGCCSALHGAPGREVHAYSGYTLRMRVSGDEAIAVIWGRLSKRVCGALPRAVQTSRRGEGGACACALVVVP